MKLTGELRNSLEEATARYEKDVYLAEAYLTGRGFDAETAASFRLGVVDEPYTGDDDKRGRLSIPYLTRAGVVDIRFRCIQDHACNEVGCVKYLGRAGTETRLFNVRSLFGTHGRIAITEGELDTVSLVQAGLSSVACPGANNWKKHFNRIFDDFSQVYVFADGDSEGRKFANRLAGELGAIVIQMAPGYDVNRALVEYGEEWIRERVK